MAKRERNKRAARKARQKERERVANAQAIAAAHAPAESSKSFFRKKDKSAKPSAKSSKSTAVAKADRKGFQKVTGYFADVRSEMRQVTWPSRLELRNYSVAVIATLIVFGVAIWLVDTGVVAALVQFTKFRG